jgi:hypothetical protein
MESGAPGGRALPPNGCLQNSGLSVYFELRSEFLKLRRWSLGLRRWMRGRTRQGKPGDSKEELRRQKDEVPPGLSRFLNS